MSEMKPWPEKPKFPPEFNANSDHYRAAQLDYQRARADAWEARCRVAVALLERQTACVEHADCWYSCATLTCNDGRRSEKCDCGAQQVRDALAAIGPLPEEKT